MTIRDRIFERLEELQMTQKEFAKQTGIAQSTVSDWKKKKTNPVAEKILIICEVLKVTPEWLLSGVENRGSRGNKPERYVVSRDSEVGELIILYQQLDQRQRDRLMGYVKGMTRVD